ncbi:MAG TPA: T9SS type A sorting domain-containing protein, partial [Saprospiraceae bacterium]|nr:T9SS type A sorting domain-containing protein [Saprospiraceae bacterium]
AFSQLKKQESTMSIDANKDFVNSLSAQINTYRLGQLDDHNTFSYKLSSINERLVIGRMYVYDSYYQGKRILNGQSKLILGKNSRIRSIHTFEQIHNIIDERSVNAENKIKDYLDYEGKYEITNEESGYYVVNDQLVSATKYVVQTEKINFPREVVWSIVDGQVLNDIYAPYRSYKTVIQNESKDQPTNRGVLGCTDINSNTNNIKIHEIDPTTNQNTVDRLDPCVCYDDVSSKYKFGDCDFTDLSLSGSQNPVETANEFYYNPTGESDKYGAVFLHYSFLEIANNLDSESSLNVGTDFTYGFKGVTIPIANYSGGLLNIGDRKLDSGNTEIYPALHHDLFHIAAAYFDKALQDNGGVSNYYLRLGEKYYLAQSYLYQHKGKSLTDKQCFKYGGLSSTNSSEGLPKHFVNYENSDCSKLNAAEDDKEYTTQAIATYFTQVALALSSTGATDGFTKVDQWVANIVSDADNVGDFMIDALQSATILNEIDSTLLNNVDRCVLGSIMKEYFKECDFSAGFDSLLVSSDYCNTGALTFNTYNDANGNGIQDIGENPIKNIPITINSEKHLSNQNGKVHVEYTDTLLYAKILIPEFFTQSEGDTSYTFTKPINGFRSDHIDIGLQLKENIFEATISHVSTPLICNQQAQLPIIVSNESSESISFEIKMKIDDKLEVLDIDTESYDIDNQNNVIINLDSLAPFAETSIHIQVKNPGTDAIGEILEMSGGIFTNVFGSAILLDTLHVSRPLLCSYDPNDKYSNISRDEPNYIQSGTRLDYTIRFQNTGNYKASFVRLVDPLDESMDLSSIEVLSASHEYEFYVVDGQIIVDFENINLPDSTSNPEASKGYFQFRINTMESLAEGTEISNTGQIYFDQNPAIITNTTIHTIEETVGIEDVLQKSLKVFPNPGGEYLFISEESPFHLEIVNQLGIQVFSSNGFKEYQVKTSNWPVGIYFIKNLDSENYIKWLKIKE